MHNREDLVYLIREAADDIRRQSRLMFNVLKSFRCRCKACMNSEGGQCEQLQRIKKIFSPSCSTLFKIPLFISQQFEFKYSAFGYQYLFSVSPFSFNSTSKKKNTVTRRHYALYAKSILLSFHTHVSPPWNISFTRHNTLPSVKSTSSLLFLPYRLTEETLNKKWYSKASATRWESLTCVTHCA